MSVGAPGKRPAIRLKATTPPRTTEGSVVVKRHSLPAPRAPMRRVLQIVADDESPDSYRPHTAPMTMPTATASDSHARAVATPLWKKPAVVLVALAAAGTAFGVALAIASSHFGSPSAAASPSSVAQARTDLRTTNEPQATPVETARAATPSSPVVPTLDVKSLPPAR